MTGCKSALAVLAETISDCAGRAGAATALSGGDGIKRQDAKTQGTVAGCQDPANGSLRWWVAQASGLCWPATRRTIGCQTSGRQVADRHGRVARSTLQSRARSPAMSQHGGRAQAPANGSLGWTNDGRRRKKVSVDARPHPGLLPRGEGTAFVCFRMLDRPSGQSRRQYCQRRGEWSPPLLGERAGVREVVALMPVSLPDAPPRFPAP
jgi:hypothetical protein